MWPVFARVEQLEKALLLQNEFGWLGTFPFNGGAGDVTISADTVWNDACGYKQVKKLIIDAGKVLKIEKSPFYIFCEELAGTGTIDISGPDGSDSLITPTWCASGGYVNPGSDAAKAQGGAGAGMLFIVAETITGAVTVKANGGNGWRNTDTYDTASSSLGGKGALSTVQSSVYAQVWDGSRDIPYGGGTTGYHNNLLSDLGRLLSVAGYPSIGGVGGGSGSYTSNAAVAGGGSGIGSGGTVRYQSSFTGNDAYALSKPLTPKQLILLASYGCLGGGGGGAITEKSDGTNNAAAGGGAGSIVIWYKTKTATPVLEANGGVGAVPSGSANGSAGVTHLVQV